MRDGITMGTLALLAALVVCGCDDGKKGDEDTSVDTVDEDTGTDTGADTTDDTAGDTAGDTADDTMEDTADDTAGDVPSETADDTTPDAEPDGTPDGPVDPPDDWPTDVPADWPHETTTECLAAGGFCTAMMWDMCPAGYEPTEPDRNLGCGGNCCVPAPYSTCSEAEGANCIEASSCTGCWGDPMGSYACEAGRICCTWYCE